MRSECGYLLFDHGEVVLKELLLHAKLEQKIGAKAELLQMRVPLLEPLEIVEEHDQVFAQQNDVTFLVMADQFFALQRHIRQQDLPTFKPQKINQELAASANDFAIPQETDFSNEQRSLFEEYGGT